jgi:hypothetical protein
MVVEMWFEIEEGFTGPSTIRLNFLSLLVVFVAYGVCLIQERGKKLSSWIFEVHVVSDITALQR